MVLGLPNHQAARIDCLSPSDKLACDLPSGRDAGLQPVKSLPLQHHGGFEEVLPVHTHGKRDFLHTLDTLKDKIASITNKVVDPSECDANQEARQKPDLTSSDFGHEESAARSSIARTCSSQSEVEPGQLQDRSEPVCLEQEMSDMDCSLQVDGTDDRLQDSDCKPAPAASRLENPARDRIIEKIKAESLARSNPSEQGPFKCPSCKRKYRTKESLSTHVQLCDFEVSTDEEEEEDEEEGGDGEWAPSATEDDIPCNTVNTKTPRRNPVRGDSNPDSVISPPTYSAGRSSSSASVSNSASEASCQPKPRRGRPPKGTQRPRQESHRVLRSRLSTSNEGSDSSSLNARHTSVSGSIPLKHAKVELQKLDLSSLVHHGSGDAADATVVLPPSTEAAALEDEAANISMENTSSGVDGEAFNVGGDGDAASSLGEETADEDVNDALLATVAAQLSRSQSEPATNEQDLQSADAFVKDDEELVVGQNADIAMAVTPTSTKPVPTCVTIPATVTQGMQLTPAMAKPQEQLATMSPVTLGAGTETRVTLGIKESSPTKKLPLLLAKPDVSGPVTQGGIQHQTIGGRAVKVMPVSPWQVTPKVTPASQPVTQATALSTDFIQSTQVIQDQIAGTSLVGAGGTVSQLVNRQMQVQGMVSTQMGSGSYAQCRPVVNIQQAQNMTVVNNVVNVLSPAPLSRDGVNVNVNIPLGATVVSLPSQLVQPCISNLTLNSNGSGLLQGQTHLVQTGQTQQLIQSANHQQLVQAGSCQPQLVQGNFSPPSAMSSMNNCSPQQGNRLVQVLAGQTQQPVVVQNLTASPVMRNVAAPLASSLASPVVNVHCNQLSPPLLGQSLLQPAPSVVQPSIPDAVKIVGNVTSGKPLAAPTSNLGLLHASEQLAILSQNSADKQKQQQDSPAKPRVITIAAPKSSVLPPSLRGARPVSETSPAKMTRAFSPPTVTVHPTKVMRKVEERVVIKAADPETESESEDEGSPSADTASLAAENGGRKVAAVKPSVHGAVAAPCPTTATTTTATGSYTRTVSPLNSYVQVDTPRTSTHLSEEYLRAKLLAAARLAETQRQPNLAALLAKSRELAMAKSAKPKILVKRRLPSSIVNLKRRLEQAQMMPVEVKRVRLEEGAKMVRYMTSKKSDIENSDSMMTWKSLNPAAAAAKAKYTKLGVPKRGRGRPRKHAVSPLKHGRGAENLTLAPSWKHRKQPRKVPLKINMRQEDRLREIGTQ